MSKNLQPNHITFIEFPAHSVEALSRARQFFKDAFGWSYKDWGDDYSDTSDSGLSSGINADPAHRPPHPLAVIYSTDLEATRAKIAAVKGEITREIFSFPGGRRFHFKDPCGNELAVWSDR